MRALDVESMAKAAGAGHFGAESQCFVMTPAALEVFAAACLAAERQRCQDIVMDLPILGDEFGKEFFWTDKCKGFAMTASSLIRSPEYEAEFRAKKRGRSKRAALLTSAGQQLPGSPT